MKLSLKLFESEVFVHHIQTDSIEQIFRNLQIIPCEDFNNLQKVLLEKTKELDFDDPKKAVRVQFEAHQIGNLMKNAGNVYSIVPESNALIEVTQ